MEKYTFKDGNLQYKDIKYLRETNIDYRNKNITACKEIRQLTRNLSYNKFNGTSMLILRR